MWLSVQAISRRLRSGNRAGHLFRIWFITTRNLIATTRYINIMKIFFYVGNLIFTNLAKYPVGIRKYWNKKYFLIKKTISLGIV